MNVVYGVLVGGAAVVAYDLATGYSVADFLKDTAKRLFGQARSYTEARLNRLEAKAKQIRAAL